MRLSDQAEYLTAIPAAVSGNYSVARDNLSTLIVRAETEADQNTICYLLQTLANVEAKAGNLELAHALHEQAIALDPSSPLPLLMYAKGLLTAFHSPKLAEACLAQAEKLLNSTGWVLHDDELSREWYRREFDELRDKINE